MKCRKCQKEIPDGSKFCNHCGAKQEIDRKYAKRGNGLGTVFRSGNGTWSAEVTIGWDEKDGVLRRKAKRKTGFSTKKEAIEYLPLMRQELPKQDLHIKFKDLYSKWLDRHEEKVSQSTINCYKSAYKYFSPLYYVEVVNIKTEHMQKCIDNCPHGTRTKENMKALGTSLFRYAMQLDIVDRNYAEYLYIYKGDKKEKTAFTDDQLRLMWDSVDTVPDVKYILILCYTGMRLGEMLSAKTENYHPDEGYFITGSKTEAGKDRIITISPRICPFFGVFGVGEYLFFTDGKNRNERHFRESIFYPVLQQLGIDTMNPDGTHRYTPHCCRHTFATLMKKVDAPATDKQKLIGHSKFEMTAYYTHTDLESLRKITDSI